MQGAALTPISTTDEQAKELVHHITEYIHVDAPSFSGLLKKRYTDFQVNEILPNGEVAHLGELVDPAAPKPPRRATPALEPLSNQALQEPNEDPQTRTNNSPSNAPDTSTFTQSSQLADALAPPVSAEAKSRPVTPTPMNQFDKGNRTKEKFKMQYGGDTITIFKAGDPTPPSTTDNTASVPNQADINSVASPAKSPVKNITSSTSFADQLGVSTTVAGWNAFADEKAKAAEPASTAPRQSISPTKSQPEANQVAFTVSRIQRAPR